MRCEICGQKECCGAELGSRIAELTAENQRLRALVELSKPKPYEPRKPLERLAGETDEQYSKRQIEHDFTQYMIDIGK